MLRQLGPGLIISGAIVGSGELIVTPKLGATVGFTLLWFIILGCVIKVFVQIELGRFAVASGKTTLEAMDLVPGPRLRVSWLVWCWVVMYLALVFQVAGMVSGVASIFRLAGATWPHQALVLGVGAGTAGLLVVGRYRLVESVSTAMVALFTLCTVIAVIALQGTPYAIRPEHVKVGLSFHLPPSFTVAFAAFGIIGVGASELIYYPYWCLEKGYARQVGPFDATAEWFARARGWMRVMRLDAWVSMGIYTAATLAFYALGAAVLYPKNVNVENSQMIEALSQMYRETFGEWSWPLFLVGAFCVLYSTVFVATASNARLLADGLSVFKLARYDTPEDRARMVRVCCVVLPVLYTSVALLWKAPVSLVFVGALAQGLMLPFLAGAAVYLLFRRTPAPLHPGRVWLGCLLLAALTMTAVGVYQVVEQVRKLVSP